MVGDAWAICVATAHELHPLKRLLLLRRSRQLSLYPVFEGRCGGRPVVVLQTGVGPERAGRAAAWLLATRPCKGLISVGVSGGLHVSLGPGSVIIGCRWSCLWGRSATRWTVGPSADPPLLDQAFRAAVGCGLDVRQGELVTVDRVIGASEKRALAQETGALAVDMESGAVAEAAMAAAVSCIAVRTILDPLDQTLDFSPERLLRTDGSVSPWKIGLVVMGHPGSLPALFALGRRSSQSMRGLVRWIDRFLTDPRTAGAVVTA